MRHLLSQFCRAALALSMVATFPTMALAQDAEGNDTPGNWIVTHYEEFGIWKSICDERGEAEAKEQRCYIRYVDVFSEAPKFAAVFAFVFQKDRQTAFQYAFERGTTYADEGLRIDKNDETTWIASDVCRVGPNCLITDKDEVSSTLAKFAGGGELVQIFEDRHGVGQNLRKSGEVCGRW